MKATTISKLKKGDYFTFKPIEDPALNQVYVRDDYDRSYKRYGYFKFNDCCDFKFTKGDRVVYIDFFF